MVNLPKVLKFDDYHEIDYVGGYIAKIVPGLKIKELSSDSGHYYGLFYIGAMPSEDIIEKLKAESNRRRHR